MRADRLLTRPFLLCSAANFLQALAFNFYLHVPGFLHELGAGEVEIGALSATTAVAAIAVRPPLGRAMDRHGRRTLIWLAGAANTVCLLYLTVHSLGPWAYVVRVLHGLAEATLFTVLFTIAADWVPASRRTEGLALYGATGMLPISLGGVLGDAILERASYAALFEASAVAAGASLLCSLPLEEHPRAAIAARDGRGEFLVVLAQRDLAPLWFLGAVFGVVLTGVFVFVKRFAMETHVASVGAFFSAYTGAAIAVRLFGGRLPDRIGVKRVLFPALATLSAGLAFLGLAAGAREVLAAGVLCGVGHGFTYPILSSLAVTRAREADRGTAIAILTALPDLGALLGAPSLGWVIEERGFAAMFAGAAGLFAVGSVAFALWDRRAVGSAHALG